MTAEQLTIITKMVGTGYVGRIDECLGFWTLTLENGHVTVHPHGHAGHYDKKGVKVLNVPYETMDDAEYDFEAALRPSTCKRHLSVVQCICTRDEPGAGEQHGKES
jgi:hypothetical protein